MGNTRENKLFALKFLGNTFNMLANTTYSSENAKSKKEEDKVPHQYIHECLECVSKLADFTAYLIENTEDAWGGAPLNILSMCGTGSYVWVQCVLDMSDGIMKILGQDEGLKDQLSPMMTALGNVKMLCSLACEAGEFTDVPVSAFVDILLYKDNWDNFLKFFKKLTEQCVPIVNNLFNDKFEPKQDTTEEMIETSLAMALNKALLESEYSVWGKKIDINKIIGKFRDTYPILYDVSGKRGKMVLDEIATPSFDFGIVNTRESKA